MTDKRLERMEEVLDRLDARLDGIDKTLIQQHEQLKYHIKRTDLLEGKVEPIVEHVTFVKVALRWVGVVAVFAGVLKAFSFI